jgi:hypothetical protein
MSALLASSHIASERLLFRRTSGIAKGLILWGQTLREFPVREHL